MIFADLGDGSPIFVDANTLIYHFAPHPILGPPCHQLLQRIERQEILGFTSTHILSEVAHRLMTIEAGSLFGWSARVVQRLKEKPGAVQQLTNFRTAVEKIPALNIQILTIAPDTIVLATMISQQTGLLSNDALIAAIMRNHNLSNLASHDSDFDRVSGIIRYAPL